MPDSGTPMLQTTRRLGLIGDVHGDIGHLRLCLATLDELGAKVAIQLGDFGVLWPGQPWSTNLDRLNQWLTSSGQLLLFVDGNHEDFRRLYEFPVGDDGVRWLRSGIGHLPRGYRTTLANGFVLAALGGAASIDFEMRTTGRNWWIEEAITEDDLLALGTEQVDILVGHDIPNLDHGSLIEKRVHEASRGYGWSPHGLAYARQGRAMLDRAIRQVRPRLYAGGHMHVSGDELLWVSDDDGDNPSITRVLALDREGADCESVAVLDLGDEVSLRSYTRDGRTISLTGREGGRWKVATEHSRIILDLDRMTMERIAGANANELPHNPVEYIQSLHVRVGERIRAVLPDHASRDDLRWYISTPVTSVEAIK